MGEYLGAECIDGGTCHHKCENRCFRRECCAPLSGYTGIWAYEDKPANRFYGEQRVEIKPGLYGNVRVGLHDQPGWVNVYLDAPGQTVEELREAAHLFNQLAEALERER